MTDYRPPRYVYPPPSNASMSTLPCTPPPLPPPPPRGQAVLDAIHHSDADLTWRLLREWHDQDHEGAAEWRGELAMALSIGDRIETAP